MSFLEKAKEVYEYTGHMLWVFQSSSPNYKYINKSLLGVLKFTELTMQIIIHYY